MGGFVAMLYGARHPGHAGALILQSTCARFDLARLVEGFRRAGGDEVAELARHDYTGDDVTEAESARVFAAFGPGVPSPDELARRVQNRDINPHGMELFRRLDVVDQLAQITCPTLVGVGELDPVTPVEASREIADALSPGTGRLEVLANAGHFPWLDRPEEYWRVLSDFIGEGSSRSSHEERA
jgi:pimeloyl-ACP methyl ester carboxylesterase